MSELQITCSTVPILSCSPASTDLVLRACSQCGAQHHTGPEICMPLCEPCFGEFLAYGQA